MAEFLSQDIITAFRNIANKLFLRSYRSWVKLIVMWALDLCAPSFYLYLK